MLEERALPRIPYPDLSRLSPKMQKMLAGTPLNIVRMAAHASPAIFEAEGMLGYAIADPEVLDPRVRETAVLRVAYLSNSAYELHQHIPLAKMAGLTDDEIEAIERQDYAALDPMSAAICRFTDEVVLNLSPSDATFEGLREHVSDRVLVNLILTIGNYMSIARLIAATGIEIDEYTLDHLPSGIDDPAR